MPDGTHAQELLLASPLVEPGRGPGQVIQVIGGGVNKGLGDVVAVLALICCSKPAHQGLA